MSEYGVKQTHGGDDDVEGVEEEVVEKRPKLDKYLHASDMNITDVFERMIKAYIDGENVEKRLEKYKHERIALLRAGIKTMERGLPHLNISKNRIAYYLILMNFQMDWKMTFQKLIAETYNKKTKHPLPLIVGMNQIYGEQKGKFNEWIEELIIDLNNEEVLALVREMDNKELIMNLKKHLMLIARDDVGENKENAVYAIAELVNDDENIAKLFAIMLKRPDEETQAVILNAVAMKKINSKELIEEIKKLGEKTKNSSIKNIIKRILG